jgi:DNA-binding response OmpR family regulator
LDKKRRVLIVEDEPLVAMMLEDMLLDADCDIAGMASTVQAGMALAESCTIDFAILDMTLGRESSFPIADALARKGVPLLFVSGYGRESLPQEHRQCVVLTKPFDYEQLMANIDLATNATPEVGRR